MCGVWFYLLALEALLSELLLVAGQAVVVGFLLHEAPGANGLLATVAGEAILMPTVALMLHLLRAWWVEGAEREREFMSSISSSRHYYSCNNPSWHDMTASGPPHLA